MSHIRTQIRQAFKTALEASLTSGYDIHASRKYAYNATDGTALVDMKFLNDQTATREVMDDARVHVASLYIRVQRTGLEEDIDDALDTDELAVVSAIEDHDFSTLLEEDPELLQVNFSDSSEAGQIIGTIVIRYDVEYRIDKTDPETVIE